MANRPGLSAILLGALLAVGCDSTQSKSAAPPANFAAAVSEPAVVDGAVELAGKADDATKAARKVIHTARLEIATDELGDASATLSGIAEGVGGYVATSDSSGVGDEITRVSATLRVPTAAFETALAQLRAKGTVHSEGLVGRDVTEEYSDLEAQLRSQTALEERMLVILAKTESVEDALAVERELVRVRSTVETLEGRRKLLDHQVAMANIEVTLFNPTQPTAPSSETTMSRLDRAVDDAGDAFVGVIGGLIRIFGGLLPLLLIGGPITYAAVRGVRRRKARRLAQVQQPTRPPQRG